MKQKQVCPKCNGNGYHKAPWDDEIWFAPFTLGLSLFMRQDVWCKVCKNKGYIKVKILD